MQRRGFWAVAIGLLLLAILLRIQGLATHDYWLDELHALTDSACNRGAFESLPHGRILTDLPRFTHLEPGVSAGDVWVAMEEDTHPPVYFVLLLSWRNLFGDSELATRSLSAVCSWLSIACVGAIFWTWGHRRSLLWVIAIMACANPHIALGQDSRPYSLSILLVSISFYLLVVLDKHGSRLGKLAALMWLAAHMVTLTLAVLTHYFAGLALIGQAIFAFWRFRGRRLGMWASGVVCAALLAGALWLPHFSKQTRTIGDQSWLRADQETAASHTAHTLQRAASLPQRLLVLGDIQRSSADHSSSNASIVVQAVGSAVGGLALLAVCVCFAWRLSARAASLLACWYLVPAVVLLFIDLSCGLTTLAHLRYPFVAFPGVAGLCVLAAQGLPRRIGEIGLVVLLFANLIVPAHALKSRPEAKAAADLLGEALAPGDLIMYEGFTFPEYWPKSIYLLVSHYQGTNAHPIVLWRAPLHGESQAQLAAFERFAVIAMPSHELTNPAPGSHVEVRTSRYLNQIGCIHVFERRMDDAG